MPSTNARPAVLSGIALLLITGVAIGYLLPPADSTDASPPGDPSGTNSPDALSQTSPGAHVSRFPLSGLDKQDQLLQPQLASDGGRNVWLAFDSQTGENELSLYLAHSHDGGKTFGEMHAVLRVPIHRWDVVMRGKPAKRASRLWPRIRWSQNALHLAWLEPNADDPSQLALKFATSHDLGETFSESTQLSTPQAVRPSFVAFETDERGGIAASWLDNRHSVQQPFTSIWKNGELHEQQVYAGPADEGICPCCNMCMELADDGSTLVAFRNNVDGFRDIWLAYRGLNDPEFASPVSIAGNRWKFGGCPHDGPSIALHDGVLHVVWMDAHSGHQRIYYAQSLAGTWRFEVQELDSDSGNSPGHPSLHVASDGTLHVVWDASLDAQRTTPEPDSAAGGHHHHQATTGSGRVICHTTSTDGGQSFTPVRQLQPRAGAFQTRPSVLSAEGGTLCITWTELSDQGREVIVFTETASNLSVAVRD